MVVPNAFYSANMATFSVVVDQIHHKMYRMSMCLLKVPHSRPALKSCGILLLAGIWLYGRKYEKLPTVALYTLSEFEMRIYFVCVIFLQTFRWHG